MIPKKLFVTISGTVLAIGIAGLGILTVRDLFFPKPIEKDLRQTQSMLRNVFEKNKELTVEVQSLVEKRAETLKEMEEKEKELAATRQRMEQQVAYVKTLTKKGDRLEKNLLLKPIRRDYVVPRGADLVEMVYPYGRVGRPRELPNPVPEIASPDPQSGTVIPSARPPLTEMALPSVARNDGEVKEPSKFESVQKDHKPIRSEGAVPMVSPLKYPPDRQSGTVRPSGRPPLAETAPPEQSAGTVHVKKVLQKALDDLEEDQRKTNAEMEKIKTGSSIEIDLSNLKTQKVPGSSRALRNLVPSVSDDKKIIETQKVITFKKQVIEPSQPLKADYLYNLGVAYTQAGLFKEAAEMYEKVLKINPDDAASHYNLGILYDDHLERNEEGLKHYQAYLLLSQDPEKRRFVQNWIKISQYELDKRREGYLDSGVRAFKHLFLTTPD